MTENRLEFYASNKDLPKVSGWEAFLFFGAASDRLIESAITIALTNDHSLMEETINRRC